MPSHHAVRLVDEAVAHQAGGADRVVVRPDAAVVVADRVVARSSTSASVRTPQPAEHRPATSSASATSGALSSSTMPVHRQWPMFEAERVDRPLVAVEADREVSRCPRARSRALNRRFSSRGPRRSSPASVVVARLGREVRTGDERGVDVALHLAQRDRRSARACRRRSASRPRSPSSPGSAGRGRSCAGTRRSRRRRGRRTRRSTRARGRRREQRVDLVAPVPHRCSSPSSITNSGVASTVP